MAYRGAKKRVRFEPRFYIFVAIFVAVLIFLIVKIATPKTEKIRIGTIGDRKELAAVLIRDEKVVESNSFADVEYKVAETTEVNEGELVAEVYNMGSAEKLKDQLQDVRKEIRAYQDNDILKDVINEDLTELNNVVGGIGEDITAYIRGEISGNLFDLENSLRSSMSNRQDYLKRKVVSDSKLTQLYEKERSLQNSITSWKTDYFAPISGRVSFQFDGLEESMNVNNLTELNADAINTVISGSAKKNIGSQNIFRVVNPYKFYALVVTKTKDWQLSRDATCEVVFNGFEDTPFTAKVVNFRESGKEVVVVLEINQDIDALINMRTANCFIGSNFSGLIVSEKAIHSDGAQKIIYVVQGKNTVPIVVNILATNGKECLISPIESGKLVEGMEVLLK